MNQNVLRTLWIENIINVKNKVGDGMSNVSNSNYSLLSKLKAVLKAHDFDDNEFNDEYLKYEIDRAISEINRCRRFTPTGTKKYDEKYEYLIIPFCVSAISKIGAEGQISHTENGVSRSYGSSMDYPKELVQQIVPLIKM